MRTTSPWLPAGNLHILTGTLTIQNGGQVYTMANGYVGDSGSVGAVTVSGENSLWSVQHYLDIGSVRTGTLAITDGGRVSSGSGSIGYGVNAVGTVTVSGENSTWANGGTLTVGYDGTGMLSIENEGVVSNIAGSIGTNSRGNGSVVVTGTDALWRNSQDLAVGYDGTGTLTISDGGVVTSSTGHIGRQMGSSGSVLVSGEDAVWQMSDHLIVGYGGTGSLTVADGGTVSTGDGAEGLGTIYLGVGVAGLGSGTLNIGAPASAEAIEAGTVRAANIVFGPAATLNFNHSGSTEFSAALGGGIPAPFDPSLNHIAGITTLTGDSSAFFGSTNVSGGRLVVEDALGGRASVSGGELRVNGDFSGNVEASGTGVVSGTGTIDGDVTFTSDGVLSGAQGQTLTVTGYLSLNVGSSVDVALGGAPTDALFAVGRSLTLDGTLNVTDQGGFGAGVYRLFDYAGTLYDNGLSIGDLPPSVQADNLGVQTSVARQVNLVSTAGAELGFWDGGNTALHDNAAIDGGDGVWRADGRNWTGADGAINGPYQPNPTFAIFQGEAGTVDVDASAGDIAVTGMQFAADGYRIDGDAIALEGAGGESIIRVGDGSAAGAAMTATIASELTGTSMLVKNDQGTLILSGTNSYTGGTRINAGVLSVSVDANLGAVPGGLILDGGTLATTASFDSGREIALQSNGIFDVADATVLGLSGNITGSGSLVMAGNGTLALSGTNAYGNTRVQSGTLIGSAQSISGNIGNAGIVVFDQATDASFAGNIAALNDTRGNMILRGGGTLTLEGASTLDWTLEGGSGLATDAARFGGHINLNGSDTALTFSDDDDAAYGGVLSGNGAFIYDGGASLLLTGDSEGFNGTTTINAGTLIVGGADGKGALGGRLEVLDGGILGGAGTIGSGVGSSVTIANGGIVAPGNSIGTLTIDGDLTFAAGSRFEVEVDPRGSASDRVTVTGTATLDGGAVAHVGATGDYDLRSTYTILSAGTLDGAFEDVTSDFRFLTPDLLYDYGAGKVELSLVRNDRKFADGTLTPNQRSTAEGIESIGIDAGHAVYDAIAQLVDDDELIRASFDALSGEIHASARAALIEDSRFIRNAANDRIRAAFGTAGSDYAPVLAYGPGDRPMLVAADHGGAVVWSSGFGSWGSSDGDDNAAALDRSTAGLLIGADSMVGDWRMGVLGGYSHSRFKANDRVSSGLSTNYHLGLYGGTEWGDIAFRTGAAYTWHDIGARRSVQIPGLSENLSASYSAAAFQAFGELGYGMELETGTRLEPFINLAHVSLHSRSFGETGGDAALSGSSGKTDVTFTTLGVRGEHALTLGAVDATLRGMVGWRHAFGDVTPETTHAFSAGDAFSITGTPIARNSAVIEAGLDLDLSPKATFGLSYIGQISHIAQDHGFRADLSVRF